MVAKRASIESHVAIVAAPELGPDIYTNDKYAPLHFHVKEVFSNYTGNGSPLTSQEGIRAVFGGSVVSQTISAAIATVSASFEVFSSQSSFLLPVKSNEKVIYRVERTADGRTFATRVVRVFQGADKNCKHIAVISFQNLGAPTGNVLNYAVPMPDIGGLQPSDITAQKVRELLAANVSKAVPLLQLDDDDPFDWRPLEMKLTEDPTQFHQRGFVRSREALSTNSHPVNLAALGYLSDDHLLGPPLMANLKKLGKGIRNVTMGVALNHNLSFHDPTARVDDWMFSERNTSWGENGRVLIHQRFWSLKTGQLIMSCTQEALIRLRDNMKL